jgi:hypothetical protein
MEILLRDLGLAQEVPKPFWFDVISDTQNFHSGYLFEQ